MSDFSGFGLLSEIEEFLKENKLKKPTEVQEKAVASLLKGESLSVLAQTGSGKTLAYALPLVHKIKINDEDIPMDDQFGSPRGIVITPTRELNQQVFKVLKGIAHHAKLRIRHLVGGDKGKRARRFHEDAFDILVTSPGKLMSAMQRGEISPKLLEFLVFDEADQLLDMGFSKEISKIMTFIHKKNSAQVEQVALFSATWPAQYKNFVEEVFTGYSFKDVICQGGVQLKRNIETFNIPLGVREKGRLLEQFLSNEAKGSGIIFVNKKEEVKKISDQIAGVVNHNKIFQIHGDQKPGERKDAIASFRKKGGLLVATDIAARGLDVENLSWILNYDLPFEAVYYVHRCGRTGRAGRQGRVYNFITPADTKLMGRINEAILSQSSLALKTLEPPKGAKKPHKKSASKKAVSKKVTKKKSARGRKTPRYKKKKR